MAENPADIGPAREREPTRDDDPLVADPLRARPRGDAPDGLRGRRPARRAGSTSSPTDRSSGRRPGTSWRHGSTSRAPDGPGRLRRLCSRGSIATSCRTSGHFDHPRFFGYIPGAGTWPAALGDLIATATNIDSGAWRESSGPSQLELTVLDWFREWIGYPPESAGVLVSGGSAANLTAIACAREAIVGPMSPRIVAYASDQTHSSARPRGAPSRVPPGSAPGDRDGPPVPDARRRPRGGDRRRRGRGPPALPRDRERAARRTRARSTTCRGWPGSAASAGSGSTSTGRTAAFAVLTERGRTRPARSRRWPTR